MTKFLAIIAGVLLSSLPRLSLAEAAYYPLRDALQVTAASSATLTNSFGDGACILDRVEVRVRAPASGTLTLRHIWAEDGVTCTNATAVAYTNTATAQVAITNAWPMLPGDRVVADWGGTVTGEVFIGRSKLNYSPAR